MKTRLLQSHKEQSEEVGGRGLKATLKGWKTTNLTAPSRPKQSPPSPPGGEAESTMALGVTTMRSIWGTVGYSDPSLSALLVTALPTAQQETRHSFGGGDMKVSLWTGGAQLRSVLCTQTKNVTCVLDSELSSSLPDSVSRNLPWCRRPEDLSGWNLRSNTGTSNHMTQPYLHQSSKLSGLIHALVSSQCSVSHSWLCRVIRHQGKGSNPTDEDQDADGNRPRWKQRAAIWRKQKFLPYKKALKNKEIMSTLKKIKEDTAIMK